MEASTHDTTWYSMQRNEIDTDNRITDDTNIDYEERSVPGEVGDFQDEARTHAARTTTTTRRPSASSTQRTSFSLYVEFYAGREFGAATPTTERSSFARKVKSDAFRDRTRQT